jgi:hypothetical protein
MNSFPTTQIINETSTEPFLLNPDQDRNPDFPGSFLRYQKKMMELIGQGYTREEAEKMCQPKPIDEEELMADLMREQEKELRWLAKLSPNKRKAPKPKKSKGKDDGETHIAWVDIKCPDQFKTKDSRQNKSKEPIHSIYS